MYWIKFPANIENNTTFKEISKRCSIRELFIFMYMIAMRNSLKVKKNGHWYIEVDYRVLGNLLKMRRARIEESCLNLAAILINNDEKYSNDNCAKLDMRLASEMQFVCQTRWSFGIRTQYMLRQDIDLFDENFELERKKERKNSKASFAKDQSYKNLNSKDQSNGLDRASFEAMFPEVVNELKANGTWEES